MSLELIMWAVLAGLAYGVYYLIDCIRYRWEPCPACKGQKIRSRLSGKHGTADAATAKAGGYVWAGGCGCGTPAVSTPSDRTTNLR